MEDSGFSLLPLGLFFWYSMQYTNEEAQAIADELYEKAEAARSGEIDRGFFLGLVIGFVISSFLKR